jgi:hypothetical protein
VPLVEWEAAAWFPWTTRRQPLWWQRRKVLGRRRAAAKDGILDSSTNPQSRGHGGTSASTKTTMPLTFPRAIFAPAVDHADPAAAKSALPACLQHGGPRLPTLRVTAQLASYVSMTKAFMSKTLPRAKPLTLPMHSGVALGEQRTGSSKIDELVVIAVRRVTRNDSCSRSTVERGGRERASSYWTTSFRLREQRQRVQCSVRYGGVSKQSRAAESTTSAFDVDEKFAFGQREGVPVYGEAVIELSTPQLTPAAAADQATTLGRLVIDIESEFLAAEDRSAVSVQPIHRTAIVDSDDGSVTPWEVEYVLHRLPVDSSAAETAAETMARSTCSVDDDGDLEAFGAAFPGLWYMF